MKSYADQDYHSGFVPEHDVISGMSEKAVEALRTAWGTHHDDYAPRPKKYKTPEFSGGNGAVCWHLTVMKKENLAKFQADMDGLNLG